MPTAYTWQFEALDVCPTEEGLSNVVDSVHWRLTGDDGLGHLATAYGEQPLGPPDPDNFTPYSELTATQVQSWVEAQMGSELAVVIGSIDQRLLEQVSPTVIQLPPPW
jgi:hypothetical protein